MIQIKGFRFTGTRYAATVKIGSKEIAVTHEPESGESIDDIKESMIADAECKIIEEATK